MNTEITIAVIGLCVAILVALGSAAVVIFQGGKVVGRVEAIGEKLASAMAEWAEDKKVLRDVHTLKADVGTLKADLSEQRSRISAMWDKLFSLKEHVAYVRGRASQHDIEGEGE